MKTTPTDVYTAYAGGNPGHGTLVALWWSEDGHYDSIISFREQGTANGGHLDAAIEVLDHFEGKPVTIHTSSAYVTNNLDCLPQWAEEDWTVTSGGKPLKNPDQWQRLYEHPSFAKTYWRPESSDHPMIAQAKELAVEFQAKALKKLQNPKPGPEKLLPTIRPDGERGSLDSN